MPVSFKLFFQYTMRPGRAGRVSNQAAAGGLGAGQGGKMNQSEEREREIAELRDRLSRLTEASLRINESLDFDTVLQGVLDSARSLTEARSGVITLLDDSGRIADFLSSGMTAEEAGLLWEMPDGMRLFEYLGRSREPLRLRDLLGHVRSLGLPSSARRWRWDPSCPLWPRRSFTGASLPDTSTSRRRRGGPGFRLLAEYVA